MTNENDRYKTDNGKIRYKKKWEKESESGNVRKQAARTRNFLKIKRYEIQRTGERTELSWSKEMTEW